MSIDVSTKKSPSVTLMLAFARSGGTILNRVLGSLEEAVVLSEVNPLGGGGGNRSRELRTPWEQAEEWYEIFTQHKKYGLSIREIAQECEKNKRHLIVRDWTYCNFVPVKENGQQPPHKLLAYEELCKVDLKVNSFVLVRDAFDVWLSMHCPEINSFFQSYRSYLDTVLAKKWPIVHYEKFCLNPRRELSQLCKIMSIPFSESWQEWQSFEHVNGDIQIIGGSRGMRQKELRPLLRRRISRTEYLAVEANLDFRACQDMLGYPKKFKIGSYQARCRRIASYCLLR